MKQVLLIGGSSPVGKVVAKAFGSSGISTYFKNPVSGGIPWDIQKARLKEAVSDLSRFSHAVILAADSKPDSCAKDPAASHDLNVRAISQVCDDLVASNIKPVFISSEYVFDGKKGSYTEEDIPTPTLLYGKQKFEIERHLDRLKVPHLIFRFSKVFGLVPGDCTLFMGWIDDLLQDREITCATDQRFSPVWVQDLAHAIKTLVMKDASGIFHTSGPKGYTRAEMIKIFSDLASSYTSKRPRVKYCLINDFNFLEPRPIDISMQNRKISQATQISFLEATDAMNKALEVAFKGRAKI